MLPMLADVRPAPPPSGPLQLALPTGHMRESVWALLAEAGVEIRADRRGYRPRISIDGVETKVLKPQNIVEMLHLGRRDLGFAGADWVAELGAEVVEVLDTGLDPVRIVAAAPVTLLRGELGEGVAPRDVLPARRLVVASEYELLTRRWITACELDAETVRSYGATEVFPPEDADLIVDNTATGATLAANGLAILAELMRSSTRLYAHPASLDDPSKRQTIEDIALLIRSVLQARARVMVELNVAREDLEAVVAVLPCMREPTISPLLPRAALLGGDASSDGRPWWTDPLAMGQGAVPTAGFAVKAAVPRHELPRLIPLLKAKGGCDIVVTSISQVVV